MKKLSIIICALTIGATPVVRATILDPVVHLFDNKLTNGVEWQVNAGLNFGGASPLPLPAEIRKIDSFSPNLNLQLGMQATRMLGETGRFGLSTGIRFEVKSMTTKAQVKNYGMEILQDGNSLAGNWTGRVQTQYSSSQLAIPILAVWQCHTRTRILAGPYLAWAMKNQFDGYVSDGYLREGDPTGNKVSFGPDDRATYDFNKDLRRFQWGMQAGVSWRAYSHLAVNANLEWGLNDIFKDSFKTITFDMYPIYLNVGFGYIF